MADTAIRDRVATVSGVFLRPGVSVNRRLYTVPMIVAAVAQMQKDLAEGSGISLVDRRVPALDMATHHATGTDGVNFDTLRIAGKVTGVSVNETTGVARFTADIPDTTTGRDIAALVTPEKPYLKGVSFLGNWTGRERVERGPDGQPCETADGFVVRRIDFTNDSGIIGAQIDSADLNVTEGAGLGKVISESTEEVCLLTDQVITEGGDAPGNGKKPYGNVTYADPGYQKDKKKRYPLDTAKHVRAAWAYINVDANAAKYTAAQVKRMKSKIQTAAKKFDIDITAEGAQLAGEITEILEAFVSTNLDNNAADIRVSAYVSDPSDIAAVGARGAASALAALATLDPDNDGDIDIPGGVDDPECPNCGCDIEITWNCCPMCSQALEPQSPAEAGQGKEPTVAEATTKTAGDGATSTDSKPIAEMNEAELREWAQGVQSLAEGAKPDDKPVTATVGGSTDPQLAEAEKELLAAQLKVKAIKEGAPSGSPINEAALVEAVVEGVFTKLEAKAGEIVEAKMVEALTAERDGFLAKFGPPRFRKGLVAEAGGAGVDPEADYDPAKATPAEFDAHRTMTYMRKLGLDTDAGQAAAADAVATSA